VNGKGFSDIMAASDEQIVALCDIDHERGTKAFREVPSARRYADFRQMLREMDGEIDAVTVSTPDHMHFPAAMMAIEMGKHVYVQKPLTHTIGEARALRAAAIKHGVVTQMGNQGHCNEGTRLVKEWVEAGIIGAITEAHCWTNRPIWPQGIPRPAGETVPSDIEWNLWLGIAPVQPYSPLLAPFKWRGFWDYGCGALGDMGCHIMDAPYWALDLRGPVKISARSEGNSEVSAPTSSQVTFEFGARGKLPPLKLVWWDGQWKPPAPKELGPEGKLEKGGMFLVGEKGLIISEGDYCESPRVLPDECFTAARQVPRSLVRVPKANPHLDWIRACKGQGIPASNIPDYSGGLTELVLLGNLAIRLGRPLTYDPATGTCPDCPEAAPLIHKSYRIY
jgi:predicted dehydrogenase